MTNVSAQVNKCFNCSFPQTNWKEHFVECGVTLYIAFSAAVKIFMYIDVLFTYTRCPSVNHWCTDALLWTTCVHYWAFLSSYGRSPPFSLNWVHTYGMILYCSTCKASLLFFILSISTEKKYSQEDFSGCKDLHV